MDEKKFQYEMDHHIASAAFIWTDLSDMSMYENSPYTRFKETFLNRIVNIGAT